MSIDNSLVTFTGFFVTSPFPTTHELFNEWLLRMFGLAERRALVIIQESSRTQVPYEIPYPSDGKLWMDGEALEFGNGPVTVFVGSDRDSQELGRAEAAPSLVELKDGIYTYTYFSSDGGYDNHPGGPENAVVSEDLLAKQRKWRDYALSLTAETLPAIIAEDAAKAAEAMAKYAADKAARDAEEAAKAKVEAEAAAVAAVAMAEAVKGFRRLGCTSLPDTLKGLKRLGMVVWLAKAEAPSGQGFYATQHHPLLTPFYA